MRMVLRSNVFAVCHVLMPTTILDLNLNGELKGSASNHYPRCRRNDKVQEKITMLTALIL